MSFGNWMMTFLQNINTTWGCLKQVSFCSLLWKRLGNTIVVSWKEHSLEPGIQTALWFIAIWLGEKKKISLDSLKKNRSYIQKRSSTCAHHQIFRILYHYQQRCVIASVWQVKLQALQTNFFNMTWALSHLTRDLSFAVIFSLFCIISFPLFISSSSD